MGKLIVEIEYSGSYPLLAQDVQWALEAQSPKSKYSVNEFRPTKRALDETSVCDCANTRMSLVVGGICQVCQKPFRQ